MAVIHTGVTKKDLKGGNTEENTEDSIIPQPSKD